MTVTESERTNDNEKSILVTTLVLSEDKGVHAEERSSLTVVGDILPVPFVACPRLARIESTRKLVVMRIVRYEVRPGGSSWLK